MTCELVLSVDKSMSLNYMERLYLSVLAAIRKLRRRVVVASNAMMLTLNNGQTVYNYRREKLHIIAVP